MKVTIKGTKIILSEDPRQDVYGALLIMTVEDNKMIDVKKGQKEYDLPEGITKKDIEALYLRIL
jgi:hypothetical protein